jgi:hypothetical protein
MKTAKTTKPTLRAAQVRALTALATADVPLTRKQIAEVAKCDLAGLSGDLGSSDPAKRKAADAKYFPSLLSLKLVTAKEADGGIVYTITAKGRKVAEKVAAK